METFLSEALSLAVGQCPLDGNGFLPLVLAVAALGLATLAFRSARDGRAQLGEIRRVLEDLQRLQKSSTVQVAVSSAAPSSEPGMDAETLAVITAAVAAYLRAPPKVVAIRYPVAADSSWVHEGREDIMLSHRVR